MTSISWPFFVCSFSHFFCSFFLAYGYFLYFITLFLSLCVSVSDSLLLPIFISVLFSLFPLARALYLPVSFFFNFRDFFFLSNIFFACIVRPFSATSLSAIIYHTFWFATGKYTTNWKWRVLQPYDISYSPHFLQRKNYSSCPQWTHNKTVQPIDL